MLPGEGGPGGDEVGGPALEDDPAVVVAGAGAEVDDPVGVRHDRLVVLDAMTDLPESLIIRCDSATIVPTTSEFFPDPDTPVNAVSRFRDLRR